MVRNLNLFRIIIAVLLVFIPLYPKFPLFGVGVTYVQVRLEDFLIGFSIILWLLYQLKNKLPVLKLRILPIFLVYFGAISLSFAHACLVNQTESLGLLLLHLFRRFEYISLFFITLDAVRTKKDLSFPPFFALTASVFVALYGYAQKYLSAPIISTMNEEFSKGQLLEVNQWARVSSTFAGHYDLAVYTSLITILALYLLLSLKNIFIKIPLLLVFLVNFHILTLTASRISIFAFWGGAILLLLLIRRFLYIVPVSLLVILSMFSSKDLNARLIATIPALKEQLVKIRPQPTPPPVATLPTPTIPSSITPPVISGKPIPVTPSPIRHLPTEEPIPIDPDAGVARSGEIRFNVEWPRALNAFKKNPLLGTGLGSISLATDNDYLRALGESGILGFISFGAIFVYIFILFVRHRSPINYLFVSLIAAFLANAIFIDVFEASKTAYLFWIMLAVFYRNLQLSPPPPHVKK